MKRIVKFLILLVMFMPILLYASTYQQSKTSAKRFIHRDYSDTYQRYLIDAGSVGTLPWSNNSNDNEAYTNGDTAFGGMLTKIEYERSRGDAPRSYLFDGKQYWSMTAEGEGHYVIGLNAGLSDSNNTPATKVTEYVLHDTKVTGKGTIDNPWVFVPKYSLTVTGEKGEVKPVGRRVGDAVIVNGVNDEVTFELTPNGGNNYLYNTCGLITTPSTVKEINDTGKITFSGINKDIACKIVFGKGLFELTIEQVNNTEEQMRISSNPTKLYVRNSEQFYRDEDGNNPIAKLDSLTAEKRGYTFDGLYYNMPGGGKVKVIDAEGNIDRLSAKNITSNATLVPEWKPQKVTITLNGNGGKWGSEETKNVELTYGEPYGEFTEPIFTGYTFDGWYTAASGGTEVKSTDICKEVSNIPLFAHWKPKEVIVSYNAHGGSVNPLSKTVIYGNKYGTLATPIYGGYKFNGWFTASTNGTQVTETTDVTNTENHSIHAQWTKCANNVEGVKTWDTTAECKIATCSAGYRLSSNQCLQNRVTIKYKLGTGETISGGSDYSINSDRFVTKNGNVFTTSNYYGKQIGSSGLADYNNTSYINILKPGYKGVSGSEWVNTSDSSKKYSQSADYNVNDFCDASTDNCEVSLQVNWVACSNNSNAATWKANNNCEINTCESGYKVSGNTCVACNVAHATAYSSGCTPTACEPGYKVSGNTCVACNVEHATEYSSGCTPSACESGYTLKNGYCVQSSCTIYCSASSWTGGSPNGVSCSRTHDTSVLFPSAEYECVNGITQPMKNCWYGSHVCDNSVYTSTNICTLPAFNYVSLYSACNTGTGTIHGMGMNERGGFPCNCNLYTISYDLYTLPEGNWGSVNWPYSGQVPGSYEYGGEPVTIDGERYPPTHRDYTFAGWREGSSSTTARKITISPSETGDKKYYAEWCQNYITISHGYKVLESISSDGTCNYNIGCNDGYRVSDGRCKK